MAPTPPTTVPAILIAGETWTWTLQFGDFPISEGWSTLKIEFRGIDTIDIQNAPQVTNDGTTWTIKTAPADTAAKHAGRYEWFARVSAAAGIYANQQRIAARGFVVLKADPASSGAGVLQSFAEQMLTLIQAEIKARVTGTGSAHDSRTVDGFQLTKIDIDKLQELEKLYQSRVNRERHQGQSGPDVAFVI